MINATIGITNPPMHNRNCDGREPGGFQDWFWKTQKSGLCFLVGQK